MRYRNSLTRHAIDWITDWRNAALMAVLVIAAAAAGWMLLPDAVKAQGGPDLKNTIAAQKHERPGELMLDLKPTNERAQQAILDALSVDVLFRMPDDPSIMVVKARDGDHHKAIGLARAMGASKGVENVATHDEFPAFGLQRTSTGGSQTANGGTTSNGGNGGPAFSIPNDPLIFDQWHNWELRTFEATSPYGFGNGGRVGHVDTGIDRGNSAYEFPSWHVNVCVSNTGGGSANAFVYTCQDYPTNDHGSRTMGLAAEQSNNNNLGASLCGACLMDVAQAIDANGNITWARARYAMVILRQLDANLKVINFSAVGYGDDQFGNLWAGVTFLENNGVMLVAAAGNDNLDVGLYNAVPVSWAKFKSNVIGVPAYQINSNGLRTRWVRFTGFGGGSNYDQTNSGYLTVASPSYDQSRNADLLSVGVGNIGKYICCTSGATPLVTTLVARMARCHPTWTNLDFQNAMHDRTVQRQINDNSITGWAIDHKAAMDKYGNCPT